jgi:Ran GTPase-activating protein (RanGAP) involved in mRNA processing and transport
MSAFAAPAATTLQLPGPRELLSSASSVSDLLSAFPSSTYPDLTHLIIGDKSYTADAAQALADQLLSKCPAVTDLNMADVIAGRMEAEGLVILSTFSEACSKSMPSLTSLDLSDNAMGLKGISACAPLFTASKNTLTSLSMCNDGLSHQSMKEVADILVEHDIQLKKLHFFNNMSGDQGCAEFARIIKNQKVEGKMADLRFSGTRASSEGSVHIANCLKDSVALFGASLVNLDLNDNTFSAGGGLTLVEAFEAGLGKNLTELNLGECSLGDDSLKGICRALIKNGSGALTKLELGGNELTIQSMKLLAKLVAKNPNLVTLGLSENELASGGVVHFLPGLKTCKKLESVRFNCCELGDRAGTALALHSAAWPELKLMEVDGNMFTTDISVKLASSFGESLNEMEDNDEEGKDDDDDDEELDDEEEEDEDEEGGGDEGVDDLAAAFGGAKV